MNGKFLMTAFIFVALISPALAAPPHPARRPATTGGGGNNPATNSYLAGIRARARNNWYLPDGNNRVEISATLAADGSIDNVSVVATPENEPAKAAASDAFSKAQPLGPLPNSYKSAKLVLTFISNVDPHGDSNSNIETRLEPGPSGTPAKPATAPPADPKTK